MRTIYIGKLLQSTKVLTNRGNVAIAFILETGEGITNLLDDLHIGEYMIIKQTTRLEVEHEMGVDHGRDRT